MNFLDTTQVTGHQIAMTRTDPRHVTGMLDTPKTGTQDGTFASLLMDSLSAVNDQQNTADNLAVQAIINPDSVDTHDVTIAAAKAEMSLSITKSIVDRVISAYREIQNIR